jgi:hypothetical protein
MLAFDVDEFTARLRNNAESTGFGKGGVPTL